MRYCDNCDIDFTNPTCPRCGSRPTSRHPERAQHEPTRHSTFVSEPSDNLDSMIETASRPTLAQLLKRGLEKGLIKPIQEYAQGRK